MRFHRYCRVYSNKSRSLFPFRETDTGLNSEKTIFYASVSRRGALAIDSRYIPGDAMGEHDILHTCRDITQPLALSQS